MGLSDCNTEPNQSTGKRRLYHHFYKNHPYTPSAAIELTHSCNMKCPHCYLSEVDENELTTDEIIDTLDQLKNLGVMMLTLTGGEPTLRPDFLNIVREASSRHFAIILKTNGSLLSLETVQTLANLGLYELNISLYHNIADDHDHFVGIPGAWQKSVAALRYFKSEGRNSRVSIIVMNWNINGTVPLEKLCETEGWKLTMDFRVEPRHDGDKAPTLQRASEEDLVNLIERSPFFRKRALEYPTFDKSNEIAICGIEKGLLIRPNGDVVPCVSLPSIRLGNIRKKRIAEIWTDSKTLRRTLSVTRGKSPECLSCNSARDCQRCPASAFKEHQNIHKPSPLDCQLANVWRRARERISTDAQ